MKHPFRVALLWLALLPVAAVAQEKVEASVSADFLSRYFWRGKKMGDFSIQPTAEVRWRGLFLQTSGNLGLDEDDIEELDLILGYRYKGFNASVIDYWQSGHDSENRYFYYDPEKGGHTFEGNLGFACKYFDLQAYCAFYGNDFRIDGKRAYSTYIELKVPFRLGGIDWELRGGMTPYESAGTMELKTVTTVLSEYVTTVPDYDYGEKLTCNVAALRATKDIAVGNVHIPIFAEFHTNPYLQKSSLVFGLSIIPF